jgi:hypothetical protein
MKFGIRRLIHGQAIRARSIQRSESPAPISGIAERTVILLEMDGLEGALKEAVAQGDDVLVNKINKALASLESEANALIEQHQREHKSNH